MRRHPTFTKMIAHAGMALVPVFGATHVVHAQSERKITQLADGVYEIQHRDANDGFVSGNTTVIIGTRQVLVVDTGFRPSDANEDIDQIRRWTNKPVSFVLNTHFHNDHNLGNRAYMTAFPGVNIVAQTETKKDMDRYGAGSRDRVERGAERLRQMLAGGKGPNGTPLSDADKRAISASLEHRARVVDELKDYTFQGATLAFRDSLTIDLGDREVELAFIGRGNTSGDAIAYLPKEKIAIVGDLVVSPMPYFYDGYPSDWARTLQRVSQLSASTIVPGHGPVMHDKVYVDLVKDLLDSAVAQMDKALRVTGPAMSRTLDDYKTQIDLSSFRPRFATNDKELEEAFDAMTADLVRLVFREAALR
jgi:glyoxylase-like metal-dependent hydrolase (beta-lactamase superfamily II)